MGGGGVRRGGAGGSAPGRAGLVRYGLGVARTHRRDDHPGLRHAQGATRGLRLPGQRRGHRPRPDAGESGRHAPRRCADFEWVYVPIDGSSLALRDPFSTRGTGAVGTLTAGGRGLQVMTAIAVSPGGVGLGLCGQHFLARRPHPHQGHARLTQVRPEGESLLGRRSQPGARRLQHGQGAVRAVVPVETAAATSGTCCCTRSITTGGSRCAPRTTGGSATAGACRTCGPRCPSSRC